MKRMIGKWLVRTAVVWVAGKAMRYYQDRQAERERYGAPGHGSPPAGPGGDRPPERPQERPPERPSTRPPA
ncbi:MAG: hypothetical protein ACRDPT_16170 [Streptomycetales bacterium]